MSDTGFDMQERLDSLLSVKMLADDAILIYEGRCVIRLSPCKIKLVKGASALVLNDAFVSCFDQSTVELHDRATASLRDSSSAMVYEHARASMFGDSTADAHWSADVWFYDNSTGHLFDNARAFAFGNSVVMLYGNASALLGGQAIAILHEHATADVCSSDALVIDLRGESCDD